LSYVDLLLEIVKAGRLRKISDATIIIKNKRKFTRMYIEFFVGFLDCNIYCWWKNKMEKCKKWLIILWKAWL